MDDRTEERELSYCDPDAEPVTDANDGEPTAADAARFLVDLFERSGGRLRHRGAVERFLEGYGGRFVTPGREGFAIDRDVRERFERLAGRDVVWGAQARSGRWRYAWER